MAGTVPDTMNVAEIAAFGGPEMLRTAIRPVPQPGPGQVLIKAAWAGVNRPDVAQREGLYPPPPGASDIPGLEVAGTVVAAGEGVDPALVGSAVCALVSGGGYAQYCTAMAAHCLPVPEGLSLREAAAMPETLFTVWHNVFHRGLAREGEVLLVHGGTSGIGSMAIKLAKLFGLKVIATCGSDTKCAAALALGADAAVNYRQTDFESAVKNFTQGTGADIILDMVAGDYTQRNLNCLAVDGRLVTIAILGGALATVNMGRLMVKRQTVTGSTLRSRSDAFKALLTQDIARNVWPFVEEGALRPAMDQSFALGDAALAHARMESAEHVGKITLNLLDGAQP